MPFLPCPVIATEIGILIREIEAGGPGVAALERQLASVEKLYAAECGVRPPRPLPSAGARLSVRVEDGTVFANYMSAAGNPATLIIGGGDGTVIWIAPNGEILKVPSEGPGDPELRRALSLMLTAVTSPGVEKGAPARTDLATGIHITEAEALQMYRLALAAFLAAVPHSRSSAAADQL